MNSTDTIEEARLPDLLIDLHDVYGASFPRPMRNIVQFIVVDENTTFEKAQRKISKLLAKHGLLPGNVAVEPGPEDKSLCNRRVTIQIPRDLLM